LGTTFIYVTHDQVEAMTMGDQIVVMNDGHIMQVAAPMDLYQEPENLFVAQFIGSPAMNIVPAEGGSEYLWGFRPEKASLLPASVSVVSGEDQWIARGQVVSREILGSDTLFHVETEKGRIIVKADSEVSMQVGSQVMVTVPWEYMYVFEKVSGRRVGRMSGRESVSIRAGGDS
jgi:sn-glycerol 3-phosphate transport system ATP-binding protein